MFCDLTIYYSPPTVVLKLFYSRLHFQFCLSIKGQALSPWLFAPAGRSIALLMPVAAWASVEILKGLPGTSAIDQLPDWKDAKNFTVDQRARAYHDINCAHCHTKGGDACNTGLFLGYEQTEKASWV